MIISINQPAYLPWLGYFDRIMRSDLHVVLDHVQFEKNSFTNRNKIRTKQGSIWLTVPISTAGKFGELQINQLQVCQNIPWPQKHLKSIISSYSRATYFNLYREFLHHIYSDTYTHLHEINKKFLMFFLDELKINTTVLYSSELNICGAKSELILNICKACNAKTYLSGPLGRGYLDTQKFSKENISILYHDYEHPKYTQMHGTFIPFMSTLDLVINHGPDSKRIITQNEIPLATI